MKTRFLTGILLSLMTMGSHVHATAEAQVKAAPLELMVLGSGGPGALGRAASSYLVLVNGRARILVDAGPGAFARVGEAKQTLSDTDIVLLTHLHIDHAGDLPGLFKARAVSAGGPISFVIWGPAGAGEHREGAYFPSTTQFIDRLFGATGAFAYLRDFAAPITFHVHDIPVQVAPRSQPQTLFNEQGLVIRGIPGHHGDAPAVIYRIDYAGKSITFSGDIDAKGLPALRIFAKATDLLIFNSVVLDPPDSPEILYTLHTPPRAIGELVRDAGVHHLLLSHISPAVEQHKDAVLASIGLSYHGPVTLLDDRMRVLP